MHVSISALSFSEFAGIEVLIHLKICELTILLDVKFFEEAAQLFNPSNSCFVGQDVVYTFRQRTLLLRHLKPNPHQVPISISDGLQGPDRHPW